MSRYRKTGAALLGAALTVIGHRYGTGSEVYFDLVAVATAAGVYALPNAAAG